MLFIFIGINTRTNRTLSLNYNVFAKPISLFPFFVIHTHTHTYIITLPRRKVVMQMKSVPFFLLRAGFERIKPMLSLQTLCKLSSRKKNLVLSKNLFVLLYLHLFTFTFTSETPLPYPDNIRFPSILI